MVNPPPKQLDKEESRRSLGTKLGYAMHRLNKPARRSRMWGGSCPGRDQCSDIPTVEGLPEGADFPPNSPNRLGWDLGWWGRGQRMEGGICAPAVLWSSPKREGLRPGKRGTPYEQPPHRSDSHDEESGSIRMSNQLTWPSCSIDWASTGAMIQAVASIIAIVLAGWAGWQAKRAANAAWQTLEEQKHRDLAAQASQVFTRAH